MEMGWAERSTVEAVCTARGACPSPETNGNPGGPRGLCDDGSPFHEAWQIVPHRQVQGPYNPITWSPDDRQGLRY